MHKTIITYGTFDMFHIGHLKLLKKLKNMGDELIVAVSTEKFNLVKKKKILIPFEQRIEIVKNIKCVDRVIPEEAWGQKIKDIKKYGVDVFAIGNDWKGEFNFLSNYCEVVYLDRTEDISTTELKKSLIEFLSTSKEDFLSIFEVKKTKYDK
ncbi:Glycerol-3-phosphate cytidylyltransferase [Candidatus Ruthia magnifica str. Cm (Calyptogena magnifica)]|uniref:Glycerol-3-phosphate cytidylyltransferase n=1 Tax=Ruthia magnifica subsp. Calyptogena magnifica TaxID=413404 RepID=A1AXF0_RUTMC|nr:adenylyltransferase/cytidyltransferase family protein [Candidatus Ruthturnera calyptogenae]ABL02607.1 Glycerol-3-phosphate cytidylyltransferase [Candidatus Ruthia magnifica str. Cm (Calyptogena magnifica)]